MDKNAQIAEFLGNVINHLFDADRPLKECADIVVAAAIKAGIPLDDLQRAIDTY